MTADLFGEKPRRLRRVMMHVADAGHGAAGKVICFECQRCGHNTGWIRDDKTVSENKRGRPCPVCNNPQENSMQCEDEIRNTTAGGKSTV